MSASLFQTIGRSGMKPNTAFMILTKSVIISLVIFNVLFAMNNAASETVTSEKSMNGKSGMVQVVSRDITVTQIDNMFLPNEIWIHEGETVRFVLKNKGEHQHEFLIGTMDELKKTAKMRRNHPDGIAADPGMMLLQPGEQKTVIRTFDQAGEIDFACPLPGHFKGMRGKIYVEKQ